ncbi:MAG: proteasome accessory factor PafA2 family protein, partial [Candidatus Sungbacteria bacterium]|nr:proteasome accessory factor PafA2 family protein [Candidatus Sungbacteria bacterium]
MHFPDRIYGLEFEHAVLERDPSGCFHESNLLDDNFILYPFENSIFSATRMRRWHTNGSCSYLDTGAHPEHATAECRSIRDAVLYAKAGDMIMNKIFNRKLSSGNTLHLFKNNLGLNQFLNHSLSYGCHENYHTSVEKLPMMRLIPLLITRQIIDGAGWWKHSVNEDDYILSQRALVMVHDISSKTLSDRGIINDKEASDTGPAPRHHIICGDSNILEFAMYLKLGTVSLTLALIESGNVPHVPCLTPVTTMQLIAQSTDPFLPCIGDSATGQKSAYETQVIYL